MEGITSIALQILTFGRGRFHKQKQLLTDDGSYGMYPWASIRTNRTEIGYALLETGFAKGGQI
jgi:hypothetical protein